MLTKSFLATGALISLVAAVPMQLENKRDVVWETKYHEDVVTVDVYTTVWVNPGETPPAKPLGHGQQGDGHQGHEHDKPKAHTQAHQTNAPPPPPPAPTTTAVPTTSPAPVPAPAPAPVHKVHAHKPKPQHHHHHPKPHHPKPPPGGGGGGGQTYGDADLTYYAPGLGSCGTTSTASEHIVAVAENMMMAVSPANPNANPYCGKTITISYGGKSTTATVVDTCPGCAGHSLDLSPSLFKFFSPLSAGRLTGASWSFT